MNLRVYFWVEDVTIFIRRLISFFREIHPGIRIRYIEEYDSLDNVLDRYIYLRDISGNMGVAMYIIDYQDISYAPEEYGTNVNDYLLFYDIEFGERYMFIVEIVNWIMRTSDTDLAIDPEGGTINFKRVNGKIYYGKESDFLPYEYIPVKDLDFDRKEAIEFTHDDEWVFCSEEHIREMERWRKQKEKSEKPD